MFFFFWYVEGLAVSAFLVLLSKKNYKVFAAKSNE